MNDIDELLNEELENEGFARAWGETELEDQIKRMVMHSLINERIVSG